MLSTPLVVCAALGVAFGLFGVWFALRERRRCVSEASEGKRERRLVELNKAEALGQLARAVAHDFNNILTVVLGYVEMLEPRNVEQHQAVSEIERACERGRRLSSQILTFGRGSPRGETTDLSQLLRGLEPMLRLVTGEARELRVESCFERCLVRLEYGELEQVIVNLVSNARDAMPDGGVCKLGVSDVSPETVCLCVSDTGVGIDEVTRAEMFTAFYTTKPPGRGTGLGLAIVEQIVTRAGGRIEVDSIPGEGSTFRLVLPRLPDG